MNGQNPLGIGRCHLSVCPRESGNSEGTAFPLSREWASMGRPCHSPAQNVDARHQGRAWQFV